jgi:hypothetical protein
MDAVNDALMLLRGDVCCWHCTLPAKDVLALPKCIQTGIKIKAFVCSFPCMIAFVNTTAKNKAKLNKYMLYVNAMFSYKYGKQLQTIEAAPSYTRLMQFGGDLSQA